MVSNTCTRYWCNTSVTATTSQWWDYAGTPTKLRWNTDIWYAGTPTAGSATHGTVTLEQRQRWNTDKKCAGTPTGQTRTTTLCRCSSAEFVAVPAHGILSLFQRCICRCSSACMLLLFQSVAVPASTFQRTQIWSVVAVPAWYVVVPASLFQRCDYSSVGGERQGWNSCVHDTLSALHRSSSSTSSGESDSPTLNTSTK